MQQSSHLIFQMINPVVLQSFKKTISSHSYSTSTTKFEDIQPYITKASQFLQQRKFDDAKIVMKDALAICEYQKNEEGECRCNYTIFSFSHSFRPRTSQLLLRPSQRLSKSGISFHKRIRIGQPPQKYRTSIQGNSFHFYIKKNQSFNHHLKIDLSMIQYQNLISRHFKASASHSLPVPNLSPESSTSKTAPTSLFASVAKMSHVTVTFPHSLTFPRRYLQQSRPPLLLRKYLRCSHQILYRISRPIQRFA
jgi:hypothetical protein